LRQLKLEKMKDKSYFLREDLDTYKIKFLMVCNKCDKITPQKVAQEINKDYICKVINIKEI